MIGGTFVCGDFMEFPTTVNNFEEVNIFGIAYADHILEIG